MLFNYTLNRDDVMSKKIIVSCPICHKQIIWEEKSLYRPFCSKRCQLVDLGEWASEENRIASHANIADNENWSEFTQD